MKNPNELSATSSWRGNELQLIEQKANIVVGVANSRTRLRIGVLLSKYSEYQVDYISSESETGKLIEEADLIIGAGLLPMKEALKILDGVEGIGVVKLGQKDIVRHKLVTRIVNAYDKYDKERVVNMLWKTTTLYFFFNCATHCFSSES